MIGGRNDSLAREPLSMKKGGLPLPGHPPLLANKFITPAPDMKVIDVSNPASPAVVGTAACTVYLKGRSGTHFCLVTVGKDYISLKTLHIDPVKLTWSEGDRYREEYAHGENKNSILGDARMKGT